MTKKLFFALIVSVILSISFGVCFANEDNSKTVNLGNEITSSFDKAADKTMNAVNDVTSAGARMVEDATNGAKNMTDNTRDNTNDFGQDRNDLDNNYDNNNNNNNNGINNGDYTVARTSTGDNVFGTGMSSTTWMWIIFAIAAVVIVAAVWIYATQNTSNSSRR